MEKKVENKDISFMKIIKTLIPLGVKAHPIFFIIVTLSGILASLLIVFQTIATEKFFNSVNNLIKGTSSIENSFLLLAVLAMVLVSFQIINGVVNFLGDSYGLAIDGYVFKKINDKASKVDAILFENPSFLDDINKAEKSADESIGMVIAIMNIVLTIYIPYFLFIGIYLYSLKPILVFALVLVFIPTLASQIIRSKVFSNLEDDSAPIRREYEYYEKCIFDKEYYKETRILGAFSYFRELYISCIKILNKKIWGAERKVILLEMAMKCLTILGYLSVVSLLVRCFIKGEITVGAFAAILSSIGMMFSLMKELICMHFGNISRNLGILRNLVAFLETEERGGEDIKIEGVPEVVLDNISFSYPGLEKEVIKHLSLKINSGETVAIVGENGAGKTTLVKLIIGLYKPSIGSVKIGGADTKKISAKSLYKNISGVFQKYQRYKMTLEENISISDFSKTIEKSSLDEAVSKADLVIDKERFPEGYKTMLSREFDGVDLSGGQWQRIAIARGFYKNHNMIVLDEPTASIDPVEEDKIYRKFKEMSKGRTSIIVTHRLGSAKIADRIIVMDNGNIVECGTHDELMERSGKYLEMYNAQSKWYVKDEVKV